MQHAKTAPVLLIALAAALGAMGSACPSNPDVRPTVLDREYVGFLDLKFTGDVPPIDTLVRMEVHLDRYGTMAIAAATLSYDGDQTENDVRLRRSGTVALAPAGHWFDNNGVDQIEVNEHGTGEDRIQQWGFDGVSWQLFIDQTTPVTWNGGQAFKLDDAVLNGSVIEVDAGVYRVRWTLTLTPVLN